MCVRVDRIDTPCGRSANEVDQEIDKVVIRRWTSRWPGGTGDLEAAPQLLSRWCRSVSCCTRESRGRTYILHNLKGGFTTYFTIQREVRELKTMW